MKWALILGVLILGAWAASDKLGLTGAWEDSGDRLSRLSPAQVEAVLKTRAPGARSVEAGQDAPAAPVRPILAAGTDPARVAQADVAVQKTPASVADVLIAAHGTPLRRAAATRMGFAPAAHPMVALWKPPAPLARPLPAKRAPAAPMTRAVTAVQATAVTVARPVPVVRKPPAPVAPLLAAEPVKPAVVTPPAPLMVNPAAPVEARVVAVARKPVPPAADESGATRVARRVAARRNAPGLTPSRVRKSLANNGNVLVAGLDSSAVAPAAVRMPASAKPDLHAKLFDFGAAPVAPVLLNGTLPLVPPPAPLVTAGLSPAPPAPIPTRELRVPSYPQRVSYVAGQLAIDAHDSTLSDLLAQVSVVMGVNIEIPDGASSERLPFVKLGPGPARATLASLLSDSNFDFMIVAPAAHPDGIENVVLIPREKKGVGGNGAEFAARPHIPNVSPAVTPSDPDTATPAIPSPTSLQPGNPSGGDSPAPTPRDQFPLSPAALSNKSGLTTEGAMSPPSSLDPQSINQQLQQMYQQRMQITQQIRQGGMAAGPANPGNR